MRKNKLLALLLALVLFLSNVNAFAEGMESSGENAQIPAVVELVDEATSAPTEEPASEATAKPADKPTEEPVKETTEAPSETPIEETTEAPSETPTEEPTEEPADASTAEPTEEPADEPTEAPAEEPDADATETPDEEATTEPSTEPTDAIALLAGGNGNFELSERNYINTQSFGYDSWSSGGTVPGVTVSVGGKTLTKGRAGSTTGAAVANGIVVTFEPGYYLVKWRIVCNNNGKGKYNCETDKEGNAAKNLTAMFGATEASYTLKPEKKYFGHSSKSDPYWLLLDVAYENKDYKVIYDWGKLDDELTSSVPATETHKVNSVVTVKAPSAEAIEEAYELGYVFTGWSNSESGLIDKAGETFPMPRNDVTLTAQWKKAATTSITVNKVWNDGDDQDGKRPPNITVNLLRNGIKCDTATLNSANGWTKTWNQVTEDSDGKTFTYTVEEVAVDNYTTSIEAVDGGYNITNSHTPETISVSGSKTWDDGNDQDGIRPDSITVKLLANGVQVASKTVTAKDNWAYSFTDLPKYEDRKEIVYTVSEETVKDYTTTVNGYNITNSHTPETISVSGSKTWDDGNDQDGKRPDSITVNLFANGASVASKTVEPDANGEWKYSFDNLPKNANGKEIVYTVTENAVDGYETKIDGYTITNSHTPETISVSGSKTWDDGNDQDGKRPSSITVNLFANGASVASKTVEPDANGEWKYTFDNLPKNANGKEIIYTVTENAVDGYETKIDGYTITNSHTPETISVSGSKTWDDGNDQDGKRPDSITVNLLANGELVDSKVVTAKDNWAYSFTDLPKYANGNEITYTVSEETVEGYTSAYNGYDITNSYTPGVTSVAVNKIWVDAENQDGIRPDAITVELYADNVSTGKTIVLNEANHWSGEFADLDECKNGKPINYTVKEEDVAGYEASVSSATRSEPCYSFVITNTHTPAVTSVSGTKTWDDGNDQDGIRPDSITVKLLADGKDTGKIATATANDEWKYSFDNLPKKQGGQDIEYTIEEVAVDGYTPKIEGYNITNSHTPAVTSVSGTKTWDDGNDQDGIRPDSITVKLLANGELVDSKVVTAEDNWAYSFADLPKNANGKEIIYTVTENAVKGYTTKVDGYNITNSHTPAVTSVSGTKTWDDGNDQDGIRPGSITVKLFADGKDTGKTATATADNGWKYSFDNLPKKQGGKDIEYTIEEVAVDGYTSKIEGYDIINSHETETVELAGEKIWVDDNDAMGLRPDHIVIHILADGKELDTVTVTPDEKGNWNWSYGKVPKYRDQGTLIEYEIVEEVVEGYTSAVDGCNITNTINLTSVTGKKTWKDENDKDGIRPDSITIRLLANGVEVDSVKVTAEDDWSWSFTDLPLSVDGVAIEYSITEDAVKGYTTKIDGYNVINTHEVEEEEDEVPKTGDGRANMQRGLLFAASALMLVALISRTASKKRENY